jgi:hypothetical protein
METALCNAIPAGMSLDGKRCFYVNPLEVWPEASEKNPNRGRILEVYDAGFEGSAVECQYRWQQRRHGSKMLAHGGRQFILL